MPVVARGGRGAPTWLLIAFAVIAALLLFAVLNGRRQSLAAPTTAPRAIDSEDAVSALPALEVLSEPAPEPPLPLAAPTSLPAQPFGEQRGVARLIPPTLIATAPIEQIRTPTVLQPNAGDTSRPAVAPGSAVVVDTSSRPDATSGSRGQSQGINGALPSGGRVEASMLANRATTVPQGTLIPAVLESGFDSTRPGFARAVVSRNVAGFDGQRTLIPRGSRLIGDYQADNRPGQNRALIIWSRLIRPDGATIEIGSPVADTVGRGGVKAKVNSHFFTRFSGAILQSALNAGVNIATQSAGGAVVLALPNTSTITGNLIQPSTNVQPTLKVKPGTSISVFVAHDLDFTDVETPAP